MPLDRDEYIEQAYLFRTLRERMQHDTSSQELLASIRQEILATTRLPYAIDFMLSELRLTGGFATAMAHLPHYFTPFQTFVIAEGERAEGKFDFRVGLEVLRREAEYRAQGASPQGIFLYQFETLCRNRLGYDRGLEAMAGDDIYDDDWKQWILTVRRQVGLIDLGDMLYVRSELYRKTRGQAEKPVLFGEKEGRIALANRHKDPLYLFAALARHLGYPSVPRPVQEETNRYLVPMLQRKIERIEARMKLLEEELRGGINLQRFYAQDQPKP
ncbi:MAG: hypothetical protein ABSF26_12475 [Thermoguttaceae bacterium]|jgi:hypothetical protein